MKHKGCQEFFNGGEEGKLLKTAHKDSHGAHRCLQFNHLERYQGAPNRREHQKNLQWGMCKLRKRTGSISNNSRGFP